MKKQIKWEVTVLCEGHRCCPDEQQGTTSEARAKGGFSDEMTTNPMLENQERKE